MYPHPNCPSLLLDTKRFREKFLTTNADETKAAFDKIQHLGLPDTQAENKNAVHRVYDFLACLDGHGISFPWKVGKDTLRDFENLAVKQW